MQVHKLLCARTVEDQIDRLLEHKRELAATVVSAGEQWITELGSGELRDLFALADNAAPAADDGDDGDANGNGDERDGAVPADRKRKRGGGRGRKRASDPEVLA